MVIALTSTWESVRIQMLVNWSEAAWIRASLIARASPMHAEETFWWGVDALWSSCEFRLVKIQPKPAALWSDLHAASVLQKTVASLGARLGRVVRIGVWISLFACASSHSFWERMALRAVSCAVGALLSKISWFLEVQIVQQNQGKALPVMPYGGRFRQWCALSIICLKVAGSEGGRGLLHGPYCQTSFV